MPFPEDWSILIVQPPGPRGRHGLDELQAFNELPPLPDRVTERLCRLVLLGILPAVVERDLPAFGRRSTNSRPASGLRSLPCREASTPVPSPQASSPTLADSDCLAPGRAHGARRFMPSVSFPSPSATWWPRASASVTAFIPPRSHWTKAANQGAVLAAAEE